MGKFYCRIWSGRRKVRFQIYSRVAIVPASGTFPPYPVSRPESPRVSIGDLP